MNTLKTPPTHQNPLLIYFIEGVAIVLSILMAFAIDAWWDEERDKAEHRVIALSLLKEFENTHVKLREQLKALERAFAGNAKALSLFDPNPHKSDEETFRLALRKSLSVGAFSYSYSNLTTMLSLQGDVDFISNKVWALMQNWKTLIDDIEVDSRHLERNREEHLLQSLIRLEVSVLKIMHSSFSEQQPLLQWQDSKISQDLHAIRRDAGSESVVAMRAIRLAFLMDSCKEAILISRDIIEHLKSLQ